MVQKGAVTKVVVGGVDIGSLTAKTTIVDLNSHMASYKITQGEIVDEAGTEAAASTAVIMPGGIEDDTSSVVVTLERPFVFVIRDIKTGTVLFVGRLVSPGE